jgi:hypothetical protein
MNKFSDGNKTPKVGNDRSLIHLDQWILHVDSAGKTWSDGG